MDVPKKPIERDVRMPEGGAEQETRHNGRKNGKEWTEI